MRSKAWKALAARVQAVAKQRSCRRTEFSQTAGRSSSVRRLLESRRSSVAPDPRRVVVRTA